MSQIAISAEPSAANPPDLKSAMQGFATAVVLLGISSMSGSPLPLFAAAIITVYVLVVPIRLTGVLRGHRLRAVLVRIARYAPLVAAVGIMSVTATNSNFAPAMVAGTLGNLALIAGMSIFILRMGFHCARRIVPMVQREASHALSAWIMSLRIALLLVTTDQAGRRSRVDQ